MKITTTTLEAGPLKRIWVNKAVLPQHGGTSPTAPAWYVECEGVRHTGHHVDIRGDGCCVFRPSDSEGPHAWVETEAAVIICQAD